MRTILQHPTSPHLSPNGDAARSDTSYESGSPRQQEPPGASDGPCFHPGTLELMSGNLLERDIPQVDVRRGGVKIGEGLGLAVAPELQVVEAVFEALEPEVAVIVGLHGEGLCASL